MWMLSALLRTVVRFRVPVGWWIATASRVCVPGWSWLVTVGNSVVMAGIGVVTR